MNQLMRLPRDARQARRQAISEGLREGSPQQAKFRAALMPQADVIVGLPCDIGDTVILRGYCQRQGYRRIGFGECRGTVLPAR